jgi:hypothetical protein
MDKPTQNILKDIVTRFCIDGKPSSLRRIGTGHINDSYHVKINDSSGHDYVLQRINIKIFRDVPRLMDNIERVTSHIRSKIIEIPGSNPNRQCLTLIPAVDGKKYFLDESGDYWRMYIAIKDCHNYDIVETAGQAFEGGRAFGCFQASLADLPGGSLYETIPNFHNIEKRLKNFFGVIEDDPANRAVRVKKEITFVEERVDEMMKVLDLVRKGKIPLRITHNDTKFNNVLLDENDKALCIIDLDTVMNGYVHYDFGDSIRTTANTGAEDEKDLSRVSMNILFFEAFAKGFLSGLAGHLTHDEIDILAFSSGLMTFIIGLRFFTDYIDGDNYFKIHYPEQNLLRTRAQFRLLESMEKQYEDMQRIIDDIVRDCR